MLNKLNIMEKNILVLFSLFFMLIACHKEDHLGDTIGKPPVIEKDAAKVAYDAFHSVYFDEDIKLYYTYSDQKAIVPNEKELAAIWTQAIFWDMAMNRYLKTNDSSDKNIIDEIYLGACNRYDNFNWSNTTEWFIYDDMMWWIISLARAYEITNESEYLDHSVKGFNYVWSGSYDDPNKGGEGGMFWGWKPDQQGKTACINYPTVIGAMTLYNITKDDHYLVKAKEIYDWSKDVLFDTENGRIADHRVPGEPVNWTLHLYNQGTAIGAAIMLYKQTSDEQYLNDAVLIADYTKNQMCKNGIFPYEDGIEQGVYAAIFAQYIIRLIDDGEQTQYLTWLNQNVNSGWNNRNDRNLTYMNFAISCPREPLEVYHSCGIPALLQVLHFDSEIK